MILKTIIKAFQEKHQRNWDTLYFAIDLHGTIIKKYTGNNIKPYPLAAEVLRTLSRMPEIVLILFTSTSKEHLKPFYKWCDQNHIHFKYLNENPECVNNKTGDFSKKFYFNVLLDDRAGFVPETDWAEIIYSFNIAQIMTKCPYIDTCSKGLKNRGEPTLCPVCSKNDFLCKDLS